MYMHILGISRAELVESFGNEQLVHAVPFDAILFEHIRRVVQTHSSDSREVSEKT